MYFLISFFKIWLWNKNRRSNSFVSWDMLEGGYLLSNSWFFVFTLCLKLVLQILYSWKDHFDSSESLQPNSWVAEVFHDYILLFIYFLIIMCIFCNVIFSQRLNYVHLVQRCTGTMLWAVVIGCEYYSVVLYIVCTYVQSYHIYIHIIGVHPHINWTVLP